MQKMISFFLNGQRQDVQPTHAHMMLGDYLRLIKELSGTKIVCAEGDCGACTVLRAFPLNTNEREFITINSCIYPVALLHGSHILTVESLKDGEVLHTAQQKMLDCHGSQCGYCTPGFVMAFAGLVESKKKKNEQSISESECKNATTGNLCRCTGYMAIIDAGTKLDVQNEKSLSQRFLKDEIFDQMKDLIKEDIEINEPHFNFHAPTTIKKAAEKLAAHPGIRIIGSGTDLGVVHNKRKINLNKYLSLHLVNELYQIEKSNQKIIVGSRVSLSDLRHFVEKDVPEFSQYIDIFASPQIKNVATLIGNIANASPIGDTPPVMLALNAIVHLISPTGNRQVPIDQFFIDYRKIDRKPDELVTCIEFDIPSKEEKLSLKKTSIRKDLDISTVNLALRWKVENKVVSEVKIAAGGIAATPIRLKKMEQFLKGKKLDAHVIEQAIDVGQSEFSPISDVRSTSQYRRVVFSNLIHRSLMQEAKV